MRKDRGQAGPVELRLISLFASLFFSVPTAFFIWLGVNRELAYWGGFLSSHYLIACIIIFAMMALLLPGLFPSILGGIWRGILNIERWWGW
ncbi:MAG: hypothetical protein R3175_15175 [Marinobacter sp.]|uniref:hypothetical protein n=1 Tax=Marinobacter sp. TaxID=50741 RepID=UPI00299E7771|nr:hypothetical protein [Marinobacter sp.]MDX1757397.1 hypothetical protein [Marinobacter sp.]